MLKSEPRLQAITILRKLQDDHPGQYPDSVRRTLERRISQWRAVSGPAKEIFFPLEHAPGIRALSDFTDMRALDVTIAGLRFDHRLYHFVIAFSRWEYAQVVEGGESFEALSSGLQNALWPAGGCAREHRTDSLSAAFKNLQEREDFTTRYEALLEHYGMNGTRNNRGKGHENGSVESSHRYLKEAVDQALMLRGHRDFEDRAAYEESLRDVVMRRNRRNAAAFRIEREQLMDLPPRRTTDFAEEEARVTRCSTFTVRGILYSAPSRLIGHRLKVRVRAKRRIERHRTESRLDLTKTLATFDFSMVPMVSKAHVMALATGDSWLEKGANVLIFGPPGGGKSHLGSAIGHALIDAGYRVLLTRTSELVQKLQAARQSLQLPATLAKLDRFDLIILDDLSYARKGQAETSVLFELIAERYERRSLLITANQPFSGWDNVFPDPGMTIAAIDRLVHHSTIFEMNVESYRRRTASDNQSSRQRSSSDNDNHNDIGATTMT